MTEDERLRDLSLRVQEVRQKLGETTIRRVFDAGLVASSLFTLTTDSHIQDRIADLVAALDDVVAELRSSVFHLSAPPSPPH